jgi:V/A-type H+-transporting ATPase subunit K
MERQKTVTNFKVKVLMSFGMLLVVVVAGWFLAAHAALAQTTEAVKAITPESAGLMKGAFLASAVAVGLGCLGAGFAVAYVGAAALGAISEKPEMTGKALIFVGLAEGIVIYGLIVAIMILGRV